MVLKTTSLGCGVRASPMLYYFSLAFFLLYLYITYTVCSEQFFIFLFLLYPDVAISNGCGVQNSLTLLFKFIKTGNGNQFFLTLTFAYFDIFFITGLAVVSDPKLVENRYTH